jgi:uncharacterized protein YoxC
MDNQQTELEKRVQRLETDMAVLFRSLQTIVAAVENQGRNLDAVFTAHNHLAEGLIRASNRTMSSS